MGSPSLTAFELINDFRERVGDTGGDVNQTLGAGFTYYWEEDDSQLAWKNSECLTYLNDAITEFSNRRHFRDSGLADFCTIQIQAGKRVYSYDSWIYAIENITLGSTGQPLTKKTSRSMDRFYMGWRTKTGVPCRYVENAHTRTIILDREPTKSDSLILDVQRRSLDWFTASDWKDELKEPDFMFREALIEGMKIYAFSKRDRRAFSENEAANAARNFTRMVGPERSAEMLHRERQNANMDVQFHLREVRI